MFSRLTPNYGKTYPTYRARVMFTSEPLSSRTKLSYGTRARRNELLREIARKMPRAYARFGLENARYIGSGCDSMAFSVGRDTVVKFTKNFQDAWACWLISQNPQPNLVTVHAVRYLAPMKMWLIQTEKLNTDSYLDDDCAQWYSFCDAVIAQLKNLDIRIARKDVMFSYYADMDYFECLIQNGRAKNRVYKCYDFGFSEFTKPIRLDKIPPLHT